MDNVRKFLSEIRSPVPSDASYDFNHQIYDLRKLIHVPMKSVQSSYSWALLYYKMHFAYFISNNVVHLMKRTFYSLLSDV